MESVFNRDRSRTHRIRVFSAGAILIGTIFIGAILIGVGAAPVDAEWPPLFVETTEVEVLEVEIVVTGAGGRPVIGLGRDDFLVFENGEPLDADYFYAMENGRPAVPVGDIDPRAEAPETEARRLQVVVFVDNTHLGPASRRRALAQVEQLLAGLEGRDARVMLVTHDRRSLGRAIVRHGFTDSPWQILESLGELAETAVADARADGEFREIVRSIEQVQVERGNIIALDSGSRDEDQEQIRARVRADALSVVPLIENYAQERYRAGLTSLAVLRQVVDLVASLPGKKALVHVSDGLPLQAGAMLYEAFAVRFASLLDQDPATNILGDRGRYDLTAELQAVAARANAGGVTFYPLDASVNVEARGSATFQDPFLTGGLESIDEDNREGTLRLLAQDTGGKAGLSPTVLGDTLESITTDFDNYYSFGFTPDEDGGGDRVERRSIEVRLTPEARRRAERDGRVEVRYRRSFHAGRPEDRTVGRALGTLLTGAVDNPLEITISTEAAMPRESKEGDEPTFVVPLLLEVPVGRLVLVPGAKEHAAQVSIYVVARDDEGRISEVVRHLCPIRVPNDEILVALGRRMVCGARLAMRGGPHEMAVAVHDEIADVVATARLDVVVGAAP